MTPSATNPTPAALAKAMGRAVAQQIAARAMPTAQGACALSHPAQLPETAALSATPQTHALQASTATVKACVSLTQSVAKRHRVLLGRTAKVGSA